MKLKYDLFWPYYNGAKIQKAIKNFFPKDCSNQWIGQSKKVDEFERRIKKSLVCHIV